MVELLLPAGRKPGQAVLSTTVLPKAPLRPLDGTPPGWKLTNYGDFPIYFFMSLLHDVFYTTFPKSHDEMSCTVFLFQ